MIDIYRVIQQQAHLSSFHATRDHEKTVQLETLIELSKPRLLFPEWHVLIATPFRYSLPTPPAYQARFRPPYSTRNVFYGANLLETAVYEHCFHFMAERNHLPKTYKRKAVTEVGARTAFSAGLDAKSVTDIRSHEQISTIMHKTDYSASHQYIESNPSVQAVSYPSCRDPSHRSCYAVFNIEVLAKQVKTESSLSFIFNRKSMIVSWYELGLDISWNVLN